MRLKLVLVSALAAALAVWLVPTAAATYGKGHHRDTAAVNVVHGIPNAVVDICAKGDITGGEFAPVITDFEFTQIEKLYLPAGDYYAKIVAAGENCAEADALLGLESGKLEVPGGANISIIAHLTNDAKSPVALKVGVNDTSKLGHGKARVSAYHLAAAPAVDIRAAMRDKGSKAIASYGSFGNVFANVENPAGPAAMDVTAARYKIAIVPEGADIADRVKTIRTKLKRNKNTIFYAVGSLADGTFTVLKQRIKVDHHHKWWKHGKKWSKQHDAKRHG